MNNEVYIVGAGTYGEVMYELAELLGYNVKGFYDEDTKKQDSLVMGVKVIGEFSNLDESEIKGKNFVVAIGNNSVRNNVMKKISFHGGNTPTLIHPSAIISPSARIGQGVYIHANANIWTEVEISDFCIISPNVVIAHHSSIGKSCLISTQSAIGASLKIEDEVFVGMGSTVMTGVKVVGEKSIIGAGAVVIRDIETNCVYAGVPAKKIRSLNIDEEIKELNNQ